MMRRTAFATAATLAVVLAGCKMTEDEPRPAPGGAAAPSATGATGTTAGVAPAPRGRGVELVHADKGDVATVVKAAVARAKAEGRTAIVYVGASWCEPCQRFHAAAARHELDAAFPDLTLVEFDADADGERLAADGYVSRFIPLFAVPAADGRSSGRQIEGSIKGDGAVGEIAPRLRSLLGR